MLTSCCGNGSGSRFLVRHGFRQAEYYNRLEPSFFFHLVWTNPDIQDVDPGHRGDRSPCSGTSSGSPGLFLIRDPQGCDTLLPNPQSQRKGIG
jgi:hypothetical protein